MARQPASKPQTPSQNDGYKLPAPMPNPMMELLFLLGRLTGSQTPHAERITELVMMIQSGYLKQESTE